MRCLICKTVLDYEHSWTAFGFNKQEASYCMTCLNRFSRIGEPTCQHCGRDDSMCVDCKAHTGSGLIHNRSVCRYQEIEKEMLSQFKYLGDTEVIKGLKQITNKQFKRYYPMQRAILVPIPIPKEKHLARGFNQAELFAELLPHPIYHLLESYPHPQQKALNRSSRLSSPNPFYLSGLKIERPPAIIIVDDVYTTGQTMHHAADTLRTYYNCPIYGFTLAR